MKEQTIEHAYRDPNSNAVIINDTEGYQQAKKRKEVSQKNRMLRKQVSELDNRLNSVEQKFETLMNSLGSKA